MNAASLGKAGFKVARNSLIDTIISSFLAAIIVIVLYIGDSYGALTPKYGESGFSIIPWFGVYIQIYAFIYVILSFTVLIKRQRKQKLIILAFCLFLPIMNIYFSNIGMNKIRYTNNIVTYILWIFVYFSLISTIALPLLGAWGRSGSGKHL